MLIIAAHNWRLQKPAARRISAALLKLLAASEARRCTNKENVIFKEKTTSSSITELGDILLGGKKEKEVIKMTRQTRRIKYAVGLSFIVAAMIVAFAVANVSAQV